MERNPQSPSQKQALQSFFLEPLFWIFAASLVGILSGSASALFLASLEWVTERRLEHPWLVLGLPLVGLAIGWKYFRYGRNVEAGNDLLISEIHDPRATVPLRMAPFVLIGTLATHLFGGSAGREGTAIQMGGSLADQLTAPLKLDRQGRQILLISGLSAGFASVFGTPLAGTLFGLEVLALGARMRPDAIFPALVAALVGHATCLAWGIHHTAYRVEVFPSITVASLLWAFVAGIAFGLAARLFTFSVQSVSKILKARIAYPPARALVGGLVFVAIFGWPQLARFQGLGIPSIVQSFGEPLAPMDWLLKCVATAITLGAGFKGGEVTPLFYVGSTLGNSLSHLIPLARDTLAALGFVAVFAGAANVPLASTLLAIELFGGSIGWMAAVACVTSFLFSSHKGIYHAQKRWIDKRRSR